MAHLDFFCIVYTEGDSPKASLDPEFSWIALPTVPAPNPTDELFGPFVAPALKRIRQSKRAFVLHGHRPHARNADQFFAAAHLTLGESVDGLSGVGIDVLRCWPFSLSQVDELPTDPLAEDIFAVGFEETTGEAIRAQTHGLAKLGQREIRFTFRDRALLDEAALLCGHLAEYVMEQSRRVHHGQSMSFGFDRVMFRAAEGPEAGGPLRAWHPPFVQRALPPELFAGVGMLDVAAFQPLSETTSPDLTDVLKRSLMQRQVLEQYGIPGDSPSQHDAIETCGCHELSTAWKAQRGEPRASRDSGWRVTCVKAHSLDELHQRSVGDLTRKLPPLLRYLALPPGCAVVWDSSGEVKVDCGEQPYNSGLADDEDV